ncbi:MAG: DUF4143 domain-containing protein [Planctomycetota bacterium]
MPGLDRESAFLWGPRQTGKSTLLRQRFPDARCYDLLLSDVYERLNRQPSLLRQECEALKLTGDRQRHPVIIDEIQRIPALLHEIHWLIENRGLRFVLCGSSARKLMRGHGNLLGGRAIRHELFPLVSPEIPDFDLLRALNHGLLPRHYQSPHPERLLRAYVGDYLREEIAAEALTRNVPAFGRFLEQATFSNGEILQYINIARECGVSAPTVKAYYQILEDTLVGRTVPSYRKRPKRRVIEAPRFYFFDLGIVNTLTNRGRIEQRSELFGRVFEHFMFQEILAHAHYGDRPYPIAYWRTASGIEVDFILGDHETAIEVKGTATAHPHDLRGLVAFREEYRVRHAILVTLDPAPRTLSGIQILPWEIFLKRLWAGEIIS